jgi:hypothetical protein
LSTPKIKIGAGFFTFGVLHKNNIKIGRVFVGNAQMPFNSNCGFW